MCRGLPAHTRKAIAEGIEATRHNTGLRLNFALNYGGREEILQAVRALCRRCQQGDLGPSAITYSDIESCLYTRDIPSPDLVIRTSGEIRISNFLLWQIAYAELYFTDTLWPDFSEMHLYKAIAQFSGVIAGLGAFKILTRGLTAAVLIPIVPVSLYLGGPVFLIFMAVYTLGAVVEFARLLRFSLPASWAAGAAMVLPYYANLYWQIIPWDIYLILFLLIAAAVLFVFNFTRCSFRGAPG